MSATPSSIKITALADIGTAISYTTLFPVVSMQGTPTTDKANLQIIGNIILNGAGGSYFPPVAQAFLAQTVTNAAQPNITSVGTLTGLSVIGNISAGNTNGGNIVNANFYYGSGHFLTNLNIANISGLGNIATINLDGNASNLLTGNGTYVAIPSVGNIATINLDGSNSNVLYGNGVFAAVAGGANTGNVTFNNVNIIGDGNLYLQPDSANANSYLDIYLTAGPDIHIAGNGETVILGTDDYANVAVNIDGNVSIQAGNVSGTQTWNFGTDGRLVNLEGLTLTAGGQFNICTILTGGSGYNTGSALKATTGGSGTGMTVGIGYGLSNQLTNADVVDPGTGYVNGDVITVSGGTGGTFVITRYNDQANQGNNNTIESNWTLDAAGGTVFPTLTVQRGDNPSGTITGQTLLFGDNSQEAIISTPDGTVSNENSQRLVINPGQGYDYGEGGDIYLWAGRGGDGSGSGGDIKIRGGQGGANTTGGSGGDGGYIRIEAGDSATTGGAPGYIDINGGINYLGTGGYVDIRGGQGHTIGGDTNITGGYGYNVRGGNVNIWGGGSANGQINEGYVNIQTGGKTWEFDSNGNLTAPGNLDVNGNVITLGPGASEIAANIGNPTIVISSNSDTFIQTVITNVSDIGSADVVAQGHHGDDNGGWVDLGFTSSFFNDPNYTITGTGDGYVITQAYPPGQAPATGGGNLVLATGIEGTTKDIIFGTGGFLTANIFGRISDANNALELSRAGSSVDLVGGGNISNANVVSANSFVGDGSQLTSVATQETGSWTLATGTNTVNLSVPLNGTYSIWVNGNIPNGIVTYTATAVVTNNNVPVLGSSYGWYYAAGNALVLTAIPTQFVGTVNNISNAVVSTTTANVFTFGITNNSGANAVVNWGYTKL